MKNFVRPLNAFTLVHLSWHGKLIITLKEQNKSRLESNSVIYFSLFLNRINTDINPCDNFYDFSCGAFDETLVPDEHSSIDVNSQLNDNIDQELKSIAEIQPVNGLYKLIHGLYEKCMDNSQSK